MALDGTRRPWPGDGQAGTDVLVGADGARHRSALVAAVVVAAVVIGVLAGGAALTRSPEPDPVVALRAGALVPRDRTVDDRLAEAVVHVELVNLADHALDVRRVALVPGAWEADVVDRTRVPPGESVVLSLHRVVLCDERASYGPEPEHLVVAAHAAGSPVVVRLPVADAAAYGGRLDDALRDPGRACVVTGRTAGPIGDLVDSWRARRAWPPVAAR